MSAMNTTTMIRYKKSRGDVYWSTNNEIEHIDLLVSGAYTSVKQPLEPEEILLGYLEGARKRVYWGNMDSVAAINHAEMRLNEVRRLNST